MRVAIAGTDPYLEFLLEDAFPDFDVLTTTEDDEPPDDIDLLIVSGNSLEAVPGGLASDVLVVLVADRPVGENVSAAVDAVLQKPFTGAELRRMVRQLLGLRRDESLGDDQTLAQRATRPLAFARLAAVAIAAGIGFSPPWLVDDRGYVFYVAVGYVLVRLAVRSVRVPFVWADVAVAATLIAVTDGASSRYVFLALVSVVAAGLILSRRGAAVAGALVALSILPSTLSMVSEGDVDVLRDGVSAALFLVAAFAAWQAALVWRQRMRGGTHLLTEANRALTRFHEIAQTMPGGFEMQTVAAAVLEEVEERTAARAGVLLLEEVGLLAVAGSFGLDEGLPSVVDPDRAQLSSVLYGDVPFVEIGALPDLLGENDGSINPWCAIPLRHQTEAIGLLLVAGREVVRRGDDRYELVHLADEAALAVRNVRLFANVRELSIDAERQRLGEELHDGVAQTLTHVRLELDFLSRHSDLRDDFKEDIERLNRSIERAVMDVRAIIRGLRVSTFEKGLVGALRNYIRDLRGLGGPEIVLDAQDVGTFNPDHESELFRIVQEGLSNAVRHAQATKITVRAWVRDDMLRLSVEDDGIGLDPGLDDDEGGLGLHAMHERASRIGATLRIEGRSPGGTHVVVAYPLPAILNEPRSSTGAQPR